MLIKGVTKSGDAIPLTPEEALAPALALALSTKNDTEFVYWIGQEPPAASQFSSTAKPNNQYDAVAAGTCYVGKTRVADDRFYVAKPHTFQIKYNSAKDDFGIPHIEVTEFDMILLDANPANLVGHVDRTNDVAQNAEAAPAGGKVKARVR